MHIAFLDTNTDRSAFGLRHPSECDKFRKLLAPLRPDWTYSAFRAADGALPDDVTAFDAVMISGSVASVNDPDPWVARLLEVIRSAVGRGVPVFGACFGHQAIAKALGGAVGPNPQGWVLGRYEAPIHRPAPWMDSTAPMTLHAAHKEQVLTLPPGAMGHGGTDSVPHGALSVGKAAFSTQYHPELDRTFMLELFDEMAGDVAPEVLAGARASMDGPVDADRMARWIVAFVEGAATQHPASPDR